MHIDSYKFGKMVVGGESYTNDLKIYPEGVKSGWWRKSGHNLAKSDIQDIIEYKPDVLIIGKGSNGVMTVREDIIKYILDNGIQELHVEKTGKAVELYNQEKNENKIGAFHLTC